MKQEKTETKKEVAQKEEKPKVPTIAQLFRDTHGPTGAKDRSAMAENIFNDLKKRGITKNIKGKDITLDNVKGQVNAMVRDIQSGTKKGWHSTFKVVESKEEGKETFKIVPK